MSDNKEDDGLRLSLSLGFGVGNGNGNGGEEKKKKKNLNPSPTPCFPLSLLPSSSNLPAPQQRPSFLADALFQKPSSSEMNGGGEPRSFLRGIDVNRPPAVYYEEDVIVSSPNSTVSSVSGKRSEREENEAERGWSSMEEDGGDAAAGRKKLRLSKEQAAVLEETFKDHHTLNPKQKLALAKQLNLRPRQVEVWFQNRRARTKLKQTEVDCEYLKRCCEQKTEENRRLQKEVNELRALKLSPQFYMNMSPPTTLTMCPQCERVAVSSSAAAAAVTASTAPPASTIGVPARQPKPTKPLNPWAAIFPSQSLDLRQPGSGLEKTLLSTRLPG